MRIRLVFLAALGLLVCACSSSGDDPTGPVTMAVTFEYMADTAVDPAVDYVSCSPSGAVFTTHLHFIWNGWDDRRTMNVAGPDRFTYTAQVPTGRDLTIALHDPNTCLSGDVYVAPSNLSANGVALSRVVSVFQGEGIAFRHESDGTVVP